MEGDIDDFMGGIRKPVRITPYVVMCGRSIVLSLLKTCILEANAKSHRICASGPRGKVAF